jgi:hypothetical protein
MEANAQRGDKTGAFLAADELATWIAVTEREAGDIGPALS